MEFLVFLVLAFELNQLLLGGFAFRGDRVFTAFFAGEFGVCPKEARQDLLCVDVGFTEFAALLEIGSDFGHDLVGVVLCLAA